MIRSLLRSSCLLVAASLLTGTLSAQGNLKGNRDLANMIAKGVSGVLEKNFYDPKMKGIDWKKALDDAEAKIGASDSVGEMYAAIDEMVLKLDDSHTNFIPPWQTQQPRFGFQMKAFGDTVRVYQIKDNSPAAKGGLKLGDTIVGIDGIPADRKRYLHTLKFYRFIQPAGVMVLDLVRDGKQQRITLRADIHTRFGLEMVYDVSHFFDEVRETESFEEEHRFEYAEHDGVGYVRIPNFEVDTAEKALWKVKDSRALIVDLRGNLGGATEVLERFAGYFHKDQTEILKAAYRDRTEDMIAKPRQPSFWDVPIAVLVDSESASASEVFARHMQLSGRGIVIGDKTMGAVSVARPFVQKIGADPAVFYGVQATIGHGTFPDGQDIEKVGVTPDKMCIPSTYALAQKKDPCLDMAIQALKEKLNQPGPAAQK
jgi:carboxyl-terminal processing protease